MRILIVEDHAKMAELIARGLKEEGHVADVVGSGEEAVWSAGDRDYDAIVLDVMLPGIDGFEVSRRLREAGTTCPVIMLTGRDAVEDRVKGLDSGADDYLTKPFSLVELFARLRAVSRRDPRIKAAALSVGDLSFDPATQLVERTGRTVELTAKESALLEYLMRHKGEVLSRIRLLENVWDFAFDGDPNVVEVYIHYLRQKIDKPFDRASIETVRGRGYRLRDELTGTGG